MKRKLTYALSFCRFFFQELGSQMDILYTGYGAPFPGPHWWKTRAGFRTAFIIARLRCDIKFDRP